MLKSARQQMCMYAMGVDHSQSQTDTYIYTKQTDQP